MSPPRRVRKVGRRVPAGAIDVTHGRIDQFGWGPVTIHADPAETVEAFRQLLRDRPGLADRARAALTGRRLACICPLDQPCHADVLLRVANLPAAEPRGGGR